MKRVGFFSRWTLALALAIALGTCADAGGAFAVSGATARVSVASSGEQGGNSSYDPSMSADGRYVAFRSDAYTLVAGDTNGSADVFVHDRTAGVTTRVSVDSSGAQGNGNSGSPAISSDGRYVAFTSSASNLVAGDTNGTADVFVHDRTTGATTRVSVDSAGVQGNGYSAGGHVSISSDGRYVAFRSDSSNLVSGDTNGATDVFVRDRVGGTTTRVSVDSAGAQSEAGCYDPSISSDGRYVAFISNASNLVTGDTNSRGDVFLRDRLANATTRASVDSSGGEGDNNSWHPSISSDGRYVAFYSDASNLVVGDTNGRRDVFVRDRNAGATTRVSVSSSGAQSNGGSLDPCDPSISSDGRYVAFYSYASNLVAGDTNGRGDVFVRDRLANTTALVSVDSSGAQCNGDSYDAAISADGRYVAFDSAASNLVAGDTNGQGDVFVRDTAFAPPVAAATSITIKTAATSATIGKTVTLSGAVTPVGLIGQNIVVYVKKPGKTFFSYSSNRTAYNSGGNAAWLYKYYFKPGMAKGTYTYKAVVPAWPGFMTSTSPTTVGILLK